ncbi:MAG TPA: neutral zinc metallopeptidase [Bryobacteraceae bacterium]|nr:neutral zinc metallopeptidase [Bryobacteraceae bacterium]
MRWTPGGRSPNLEDRRGAGGGGLRLGRGGAGLGLGGLLLMLVLSFIFGQDFLSLLSTSETSVPYTRSDPIQDANEEPMVQFVSFVLDDLQKTWRQILPAAGRNYRDAKLVLFRDTVQSGCGFAEAQTGPFYCPADEKVYIDLSFFAELHQRFGAPGDFAQAYVLAHEIGHHVQHVLGIDRQVRRAQDAGVASANELSVRTELQADCLAGVWGHSTAARDILEKGDVEEGLNAAAAIGDDRLQRMGRGHVSPETFTHGSSEQRAGWFRRGFETGDVSACDTFGAGAR